MSSEEDGYLWSFGYGSNMDVTALQAKKHVKIKGKCAYITIGFFQREGEKGFTFQNTQLPF